MQKTFSPFWVAPVAIAPHSEHLHLAGRRLAQGLSTADAFSFDASLTNLLFRDQFACIFSARKDGKSTMGPSVPAASLNLCHISTCKKHIPRVAAEEDGGGHLNSCSV